MNLAKFWNNFCQMFDSRKVFCKILHASAKFTKFHPGLHRFCNVYKLRHVFAKLINLAKFYQVVAKIMNVAKFVLS